MNISAFNSGINNPPTTTMPGLKDLATKNNADKCGGGEEGPAQVRQTRTPPSRWRIEIEHREIGIQSIHRMSEDAQARWVKAFEMSCLNI